MRGQLVREHFSVALETHEGVALRRVLEDVKADGEFPLNEQEDEVLDGLIELLVRPDEDSELASILG